MIQTKWPASTACERSHPNSGTYGYPWVAGMAQSCEKATAITLPFEDSFYLPFKAVGMLWGSGVINHPSILVGVTF